ncbi:hypothetical protein HM1_2494 [Heliomicrobium modesticaldum Ice1]|uniref:Uncharacterized protein n=1 Tax=Heliobacterium modesticaldum (strain ATCC 51547 / Ice1) TaxID=498761 RepID=B0TAJ2_HELMI|nr:hypothetical protein HM1_2494 [Heliomicrobium modesticaldum Ice1]
MGIKLSDADETNNPRRADIARYFLKKIQRMRWQGEIYPPKSGASVVCPKEERLFRIFSAALADCSLYSGR